LACQINAFSLDCLLEMIKRTYYIFCLALWLFIAMFPAFAQGASPYRVRVERMTFHPDQPGWLNLFVDVVDSEQKAVKELDESRFSIQENQYPPIKALRAEPYVVTDRVVTYLVLVEPNQDIPTSLTLVQDATAAFIEEMGFRYSGAVASYLDRFQIIAGSQENQVRLTELLYAISPQPGSPKLLDGLMAGTDFLIKNQSQSSRLVMVVFTEGRDAQSLFSFDAVKSRISDTGIILFVVGYGDPDLELHQQLESLAWQSGGAAWFSTLPDELPDMLKSAADRIKNQYIVTYPSSAVKNGERIEKVVVTVEGPQGHGQGTLLVEGPDVPEPFPWPYYAAAGGGLILLIGFGFWLRNYRNKKR
jgi:hypothetical protein